MAIIITATPTPANGGSISPSGPWSIFCSASDNVFPNPTVQYEDDGAPPFAISVTIGINGGGQNPVYDNDNGFSVGYTGTDGVSGAPPGNPSTGTFSFSPTVPWTLGDTLVIQIHLTTHNTFSGQRAGFNQPPGQYTYTVASAASMTFTPSPSTGGSVSESWGNDNNVYIDVTENGAGLGDPSPVTLTYQINGAGPVHNVIIGGIAQAGWAFTTSALGGQTTRITFYPTTTITGNPSIGDALDFSLTCTSTGDPSETGTWNWVLANPITETPTPANGSTNVSPLVIWQVVLANADIQQSITISSLTVTVTGEGTSTVYNGSSFIGIYNQPGSTVFNTGGPYNRTITVQRAFGYPSGATVSFVVNASITPAGPIASTSPMTFTVLTSPVDVIGSFEVYPTSGTINDGKDLVSIGGASFVGPTFSLSGSVLPPSWTTANTGSGAVLVKSTGITLSTGHTTASVASITTVSTSTYRRNFDCAVDFQLVSPMQPITAATEPVSFYFFSLFGDFCRVAISLDPTVNPVSPVATFTATTQGVPVSCGNLILDPTILPTIRSIRIVRRLGLTWAFVGARSGTFQDDWTVLYPLGQVKMVNDPGTLSIQARNLTTTLNVSAIVTNFTSRGHVAFNDILVPNKQVVDITRAFFTAPEVNASKAGNITVYGFGEGLLSSTDIASTTYQYTLPTGLTIGGQTPRLEYYEDEVLHD